MSSLSFFQSQQSALLAGSSLPDAFSDDTASLSERDSVEDLPETMIGHQIYSREGCQIYLQEGSQGTGSRAIKHTPHFEEGSQGTHQRLEIEFYSQLQKNPQEHLLTIHSITQNSKKLIVEMQYACRGDLHQILCSDSFKQIYGADLSKKLSWVKRVTKQVVNGLQELHGMGFVYRDLKPSNIVVTHAGQIKLCDYGLVGKTGTLDSSLCGTCEYLPPERLISEKRKIMALTEAVDSWALGAFMFELLMGHPPFEFDGSIDNLVEQMYGGYLSLSEAYPTQCRHFIFNLLNTNPRKRLALQQVLAHPFFTSLPEGKTQLFEGLGCHCQCPKYDHISN